MARLPQLRVTVNAQCGRACFYCRPSGEALATNFREQLDVDEMLLVASTFARYGIKSIKLTGGDPALWGSLIEAVRRLKEEVGFKEVHVISRHPSIGKLAQPLAAAKLDLLNVSLDTLQPEVHHNITGINDLPDILRAIRLCIDAGLPVKVNTVVMRGYNDMEIEQFAEHMASLGVRELKLLDVIQDLDEGDESFVQRLKKMGIISVRDLYVPLVEIIERLSSEVVTQTTVNQGELGHPMQSLRLRSGLTVTIKDHHTGAWYGDICKTCSHYPCHDALMALRLTADMRLQFCLLNANIAVDLRPFMAEGEKGMEKVVRDALAVYGAAEFDYRQASAIAVAPHS